MYVIDILISKDEELEKVQEEIYRFLEEDLGMDSLLMTTYNSAEMVKDVLNEQFPQIIVNITDVEPFRCRG